MGKARHIRFRCSRPHQLVMSMSALQKANIAAYVINFAATFGQGLLTVFGGKNNGQISAEYTTIVTPAGYAFGIWGIIFTGELAFTVWQALPAQKDSQVVTALGYWWAAACVFQALWGFAFSFLLFWPSTALLFAVTASLGVMYHRLHANNLKLSTLQWCLCIFPFTVHFGWCIAASLVNANISIVASGADENMQYHVAVATLVVALVLPALLAWPLHEPLCGSTAAWALIAIAMNLMGDKTGDTGTGVFQQGPAKSDIKDFSKSSLHSTALACLAVAAIQLAAALFFVLKVALTPKSTSDEAVEYQRYEAVLTGAHAKQVPVPDESMACPA